MNDNISKPICNSDGDKSNESKNPICFSNWDKSNESKKQRIIIRNIQSKIKNQDCITFSKQKKTTKFW